MDTRTLIRTLESIRETEGTGVTLTLNLAGRGGLAPEARIFLKKEFESNLSSEARPANVRTALRKIARRVEAFVHTELDPSSKGLFLVAGPRTWQPVELKIPLRNFVTVGSQAYLAPLLAAEAAHPRAYVVEVNAQEAVLHELHLGAAQVLRTLGGGLSPHLQERIRTSRSKAHASTGPGSGGSARDREQQRKEESGRNLVHHAAIAVNELHAAHPAEAVYLAGPEDAFGEFSSRLTTELKSRAMALGARGAEDLALAQRELAACTADRLERQVLEFQDRRAQGLQAALGPRDVLDRLYAGQLERIFLDAYDPMPGVLCTGCGVRDPGLRLRCPFCGALVVPTSITQDIVAHGRRHGPPAITFVGPNAGWLRDLGGLAALLSSHGAPRRTTPALL